MKAYVYISLKKSVLDPQGKTIQSALKKMGYKGLEDVRQGKYFELTLDGGLTRIEAETEIARIAREVLTNPVTEEFRFSLDDWPNLPDSVSKINLLRQAGVWRTRVLAWRGPRASFYFHSEPSVPLPK